MSGIWGAGWDAVAYDGVVGGAMMGMLWMAATWAQAGELDYLRAYGNTPDGGASVWLEKNGFRELVPVPARPEWLAGAPTVWVATNEGCMALEKDYRSRWSGRVCELSFPDDKRVLCSWHIEMGEERSVKEGLGLAAEVVAIRETSCEGYEGPWEGGGPALSDLGHGLKFPLGRWYSSSRTDTRSDGIVTDANDDQATYTQGFDVSLYPDYTLQQCTDTSSRYGNAEGRRQCVTGAIGRVYGGDGTGWGGYGPWTEGRPVDGVVNCKKACPRPRPTHQRFELAVEGKQFITPKSEAWTIYRSESACQSAVRAVPVATEQACATWAAAVPEFFR